MALLLLGFLLAASALGSWDTPFAITNRSRDSTFPQMYIDPNTKITHAVWIDSLNMEYRLAYARINPDNTMSTPILLESAHRARLSQIIGSGDGKRILITYDAKRGQGDKVDCAADTPQGCYEIFFIESKDGGMTWSSPVMIKHSLDYIDRKGPRIDFVKETSQVIITYWASGPMAFTTRKSDTSDFTTETLFPFSKSTAYQSIVHTYSDNGTPIFHFFYVNWSYPNEHLMYTQSEDNGQTWLAPKQLQLYVHKTPSDSFFRPFAVANHRIMAKAVYVAFVLNNEVHMKWTLDNGNTWSPLQKAHDGNAIAPRIQICPTLKNEKPKVYLLYALRKAESQTHYVFGSLNQNTWKYEDEEFPFKSYLFNWDYMVDCYIDNYKKTVVSAILETYVQNATVILLSKNDAIKAEMIE